MSEARSSAILGTQQSPIDIVLDDTFYVPDLGPLDIRYADKTAQGSYEGDNFVVSNSKDLLLVFGQNKYTLVKIHFHLGCEHLVDGESTAKYELHLVHQLLDPKHPSTDKLVLGLFFKPKGGSHRGESFKQLGLRAAGKPGGEKDIPLKDFVPEDATRWVTYQGSLTSYPFTEDVTWVVNLAIETLDAKTVKDLIVHHAGQEVRPVQPLNRRYVLRNHEDLS